MTFLTSLKPCIGLAGDIQRRALENWRNIFPEARIVVFGKVEGSIDFFSPLHVQHIQSIKAANQSVPFFDDIAKWVKQFVPDDVCIYLNADILLPSELPSILASTLPQVELLFKSYPARQCPSPFLMIGQRFDLRDTNGVVPGPGVIHPPAGMDYFIFRSGMFTDMAPLIVGRGGYDSAIITYCLRHSIPVVDASQAFLVYHQPHEYGHVMGGKMTAHRGNDAQANMGRHNLRNFAPHCIDADWMLVKDRGILPNSRRSLLRRLELEFYYKKGYKWCPPFNQLWNILHRGSVAIPK